MTDYPTLTIAGIQSNVVQSDPEANLQELVRHSTSAKESGAQYVVFPECFLTGYCFDSEDEMKTACLKHDHAVFERISKLSEELQIAISCGTLFQDRSGDYFNSVLTWNKGTLVNTYHKTHLPFLGVDRFVKPGPGLATLFEIESVKIGMHICYEGGFPEIGRSLSLQGADLLVLPTNWPPGSGVSCDAIPSCRSLENKVYFIAVNRIGIERETPFIGNSSITDTVGKIMDQKSGAEEGMIIATIDTKPSREKKVVHTPGVYEVDRIGDRRPDLYQQLTQ